MRYSLSPDQQEALSRYKAWKRRLVNPDLEAVRLDRHVLGKVLTPDMTAEQREIIILFARALAGPTGDGRKKREAGLKPSWKIDTHEGSFWSHISKWKRGELVDPDSGSHTLVHGAWRLLALALQDLHPEWREEVK